MNDRNGTDISQGETCVRKDRENAFESMFHELHGEFHDRSITVSKELQKRPWNVRTTKNANFGRFTVVKLLATGCAFVGGVVGTLLLTTLQNVFVGWCICSAVIIVADGFQVFDRILAWKTRLLFSVSLAMIALATLLPAANIIIVAVCTTLLSICLGRLLNNKWLASESWLVTKASERTLAMDPDGRAVGSWNADGRRSLRTLLLQMGQEVSDDVLDVVFKYIWIHGYETCWAVIGDAHCELEQARKRINICHEKMDDLTKENNRLLKLVKELECDNRSLHKTLDDSVASEATFQNQIKVLRIENDTLRFQVNELIETNDALIAELRCNDGLKDMNGSTKLSREEIVAKYLNANVKQSEIAIQMGLSKSSVSRLAKKAKELGLVQSEGE